MQNQSIVQNWKLGSSVSVLEDIHQEDMNIAIYERGLDHFGEEIEELIKRDIEFRASGDISTIIKELSEEIGGYSSVIIKDVKSLLEQFRTLAGTESFRLMLATVKTDMCRKFHTDINDLRLLCTYSGPGTLWLTDDNVNRRALGSYGSEENIVIEEQEIRQANAGDVLLLKGAVYPNDHTRAIVHRSPVVEDKGITRLILRIDTNEFLNY